MRAPKLATLRRQYQLLEISLDGLRPLPDAIVGLLTQHMRYVHMTYLHGQAAFDPRTGERSPVQLEDRYLYRFDDHERLICGRGYLPRIRQVLHDADWSLREFDLTPPRPRPAAFEPDWDRLVTYFEPRERQDEAIAAIADNEMGLIIAPPGFGKTHLFSAVALLYPQATIAIVVPDIDNAGKTVRYLTRYIPSVGQIGGGKAEKHRVTVYTQGSLHKLAANGEVVDIVLVDEAHKAGAERVSVELARISAWPRMFGFTATPTGRLDRADAKLESVFGQPIFEMVWQEAEDLGLVVPIEVHWHNVLMQRNPAAGYKDVPRKRHGIWRNHDRNEVIANVARQYPDEEQVLILVATIEHAIYLKQLLPEFELCYANLAAEKLQQYQAQELLDTDYSSLDRCGRERLRQDFEQGRLKKVISTEVWGTGVSFDSLQVLILAAAKGGNKIWDEQAPGRTSRIHAASGKQRGVVHDFLDQFDDGFHRAAKARRRNYESKDWRQVLPQQAPRTRAPRGGGWR